MLKSSEDYSTNPILAQIRSPKNQDHAVISPTLWKRQNYSKKLELDSDRKPPSSFSKLLKDSA
jgi:hypothetical protein